MADNSYQFNLFNFGKEHYKITKPIRLIELFSGVGAQAKALEILGVPFEHWKTCEWAVNSIKSYNAIHIKDYADYSKDLTKEQLIEYLDGNISTNYNEPCNVKRQNEQWLRDTYNNCVATHNLMNIMKTHGKDLEIVDTDKYEYVMTYSFPCQDLSLAGNRRGMATSQADGGTRSGLLWEVERILDELENKPQILLMENVPEVIGTKNVEHFNKWLAKLESLGYSNFFQILNAKDYGIPQNRRRCFMVSILGDCAYDFPLKIKLEYRLKDFLEKQVDEKYYIKKFNKSLRETLEQNKIKDFSFIDAFNRKVNNSSLTGTITTGVSCRNETYIAVSTKAKFGVCEQKNLKQEMCEQLIKNGRVKENDVIRHSYTKSRMSGEMKDIQENNICPTLDTRADCLGVVVDENNTKRYKNYITWKNKKGQFNTQSNRASFGVDKNLRIRKLTPTECMRLMGFEDTDTQAMYDVGLSNANIYHCAGDSIVVTCLMGLFGTMLMNEKDLNTKIKEYVERIS